MVKELILDNDEVTLPGVGSFIAEIVPSSFSDKGYTINPPYRRLSFRQKEVDDGGLLTKLYAKSNDIDTDTAARILKEFLTEMRNILEVKKIIIFPGLGRLRATRENHFFFIADEDLDIYPEGFGLEPISLKTHEETMSEVSETIATLRTILNPETADAETNADVPVKEERTPGIVPDSGDNASQTDEATPASSDDVPVPGNDSDHSEDQAQAETHTEPEEAKKETPDAEAKGEDNAEVTTDAAQESHSEASETEAEKAEGEKESETATEPTTEAEARTSIESEAADEAETGAMATAEAKPEATDVSPAPVKAPDTEPKNDAATVPSGHTGGKILKWTIIVLAVLALTALAAFLILARIEPDFIDSILYTPEELEILNL